ncbi:unnamed protein product [Lepeophtheirus salmonis]|uniref:(salmon louse) hypothetical protein n=1 Tax=Lepeophtheirus salmonis TaxID=72036 RepID=A0A7R8H317_LEPSM|nr:unnamed protein product [Lepeophtheirus salmonis]CAF2822784.1 unnamed protein product [Lepeophtheirus salmonis]
MEKKKKIISTISQSEDVFTEAQVGQVLSEFHGSISHTAWPFLAYIEVYRIDMETKMPDATMIQSVCTGALVNTQFVLSAAHCFCLVDPPLTCADGKNSFVNYNSSKRISIWIGANSESLEQRYSSFENDFKFQASSIILYPDYFRLEGGDMHDIALVKLDRPICDPSLNGKRNRAPIPIEIAEDWLFNEVLESTKSADIKIMYEEVFGKDSKTKFSQFKVNPIFRAGYGISHEVGTCRTQMGPSPLERCKFPFKVKYASGLENTDIDRMLQKDCLKFEKIWKKKNNKTGVHLIRHGHISIGKKIITESFQPNYQILDVKGNCTKQCYPIDMLLDNLTRFNDAPTNYGTLNYGWCATCDPKAKPGENNYCGTGSTGNENDEIGIAWPEKNWGFCSKECSKINETLHYEPLYSGTGYMFFLNDSTCKSLIEEAGMEINLVHEFCATDILLNQQRRFKVNFETEEFEEISQIENTEHETILGTLDRKQIICNGDSGGPVWMIMAEKSMENKSKVKVVPYLVGITRRSDEAKPKEKCPDEVLQRINEYRMLRMNNVDQYDYYSDEDNGSISKNPGHTNKKPIRIDLHIKVPTQK